MNKPKVLLRRDLLPPQIIELIEILIFNQQFFDDKDIILSSSFYNTIILILKSYGFDKTYDGELPPKCSKQILYFIIENIRDCVIELVE